jgi:tellurite resistance protein
MNTDAQRLEDLFFQAEDKRLIESLKKLKKHEQDRKALAEITGIENDAILNHLVKLKVSPAQAASLSIYPLVAVAWADGSIGPDERQSIMSILEKEHLFAGLDREIIEAWLECKPSADLATAWEHYVQGLCQQLTDEERHELRDRLLEQAQKVAHSEGGLFGVGALSAAEKKTLAWISQGFGA